ncbi:MAG: HAD hydrolase-like protein, partial [Mogibacterium sp.]|nr:HAD hydrolase-like protein [Mogibacterium sp.]
MFDSDWRFSPDSEWLKSPDSNNDIALASSTDSVLIKKELTKSGLLSFFSVIIGGDMIKHSKPAPDIFVRACAELGCPPSSSYVIEDSENG